MKLLFKQRFFSWFDSYDIYGENGEVLFTVEGCLSWGHRLHILDRERTHIGTVQEKVLTFLPKFELYIGEHYMGCIAKAFTFFRSEYNIDCNGWHVQGDILDWDYSITDAAGQTVAEISKEILHFTDTYSIDVVKKEDILLALMVVLAIDAEKCSKS